MKSMQRKERCQCCNIPIGKYDHLDYCHECYREYKRIINHNHLCKKVGLIGTLTVNEWMETLEFFQWRCAYCGLKEFEIVEHFIPVSIGGGTTKSNCVPSCRSCNSHKGDTHPDNVTNLKLDHVRIYLASLK